MSDRERKILNFWESTQQKRTLYFFTISFQLPPIRKEPTPTFFLSSSLVCCQFSRLFLLLFFIQLLLFISSKQQKSVKLKEDSDRLPSFLSSTSLLHLLNPPSPLLELRLSSSFFLPFRFWLVSKGSLERKELKRRRERESNAVRYLISGMINFPHWLFSFFSLSFSIVFSGQRKKEASFSFFLFYSDAAAAVRGNWWHSFFSPPPPKVSREPSSFVVFLLFFCCFPSSGFPFSRRGKGKKGKSLKTDAKCQ